MHIEHHMQWAMKKYRKLHPNDPLPTITPHVLGHTFCTDMANAGMDIKDLQSDPLLADAICDRIVHDAYTVVIGGKESMRKRKGLQEI